MPHTSTVLHRAGLAIALLLLVAAALTATGHPLVSYAHSGSMEPTIGTFDAFLVNPFPGKIQVGDIIVFDSITRGGPAVHRVVGGDAYGWYTQGDANPNVDQAAGEPVVTPDRIRGRVVTMPDGTPILLEGLGISLTELRVKVDQVQEKAGGEKRLAGLAAAAAAAVLAVPAFAGRRGPPPSPPRVSPRLRRLARRMFPRGILGRHLGYGLLALLVLSSTFAAHRADIELESTLVVLEDPTAADGTRSAGPGQTIRKEGRVGSLGFLPTLVLLEPGTPHVILPDDVHDLGPWSTTTFTFRQVAGNERGAQHDSIVAWRYPDVLPQETTLALHDVAPGSPYVVVGTMLGLTGYAMLRAMGVMSLPVGRWLGLREEWL